MFKPASNRKVLKEYRPKTILSGGEIESAEQIEKKKDILANYRKQKFFGIVPCKCQLGTYHYLYLNDDNVAEHLLAFGCFGYERATAAIFTELSKDADMVLDLGSFTGYYSILAGRLGKAKNIIAIEANPLNFQRLKDNLKINGLRAYACNNALVPSEDLTEFIDIKFNSKLRVLDTGGFVDHDANDVVLAKKNKLDTYSIKTTSIQKILLETSHSNVSAYVLAKIDIEGLEVPISKELFKRYSDNLIAVVEILFEPTFDKLRSSLRLLGSFSLAYVNEDNLSIVDVTESSWHDFRVKGSRNFLICSRMVWDRVKDLNIREFLSRAE